ncbi:hypothetical protein QTP88_010684 [Uroleucon formosanum]
MVTKLQKARAMRKKNIRSLSLSAWLKVVIVLLLNRTILTRYGKLIILMLTLEQQDAAEFISALISLYEPLHNSLLHQLQTILKCSWCETSKVHISNNYIIQLNVPNDTKTFTMHSMLNDMSKEVTIENITCSACNTTTNILNAHEYLYFQIQLWSDMNTKSRCLNSTKTSVYLDYLRYTTVLSRLPKYFQDYLLYDQLCYFD